MLESITLNARRAAELVMLILAYAGKGRFFVGPLDLSALVRGMEGLLATKVSAKAALRFELADGLPPVEADATQLEQTVLNLVVNASEAIIGSGTITIRTFQIAIEAGTLWSAHLKEHLPAGQYVGLELTDTGSGMSADVMSKIFDPFFTTKFTGRGLGLAAVQGIAHGHRGVFQVRSEPGRGSEFRLLLPASSEAVVVPVISALPTRTLSSGTILVIDDEDGIRAYATRILEREGFAVLAFGRGAEGVERFRDQPDSVEVALLDLTMPGMDGLEVARVLRGLREELPIILMSGYTVHDVMQRSLGFAIAAFVQKPFTPLSLLNAVHQALGK